MRLGDLLISTGAISREQLEQALELQKGTKQRLGDVLIQNGFITEKSLIDALKIQLGIEFIDLTKVSLPIELAKFVPKNIARRFCVVPCGGGGYAVPCHERPAGLHGAGGGQGRLPEASHSHDCHP